MTMSEKVEFLVREERGEEIERNAVADELRSAAVDIFDAYERELFVAFLWRTYLAGHCIACLEGVDLDLLLGYVDIVRGVEIVVV